MAANDDYIPSNDAEFDNWYKNLCQFVTGKTTGDPPEWTHIPASEVKLLTDNYLVWRVAYIPTLKPHTPAETLAKNEARKTIKSGIIRPFVGQWLMWKQVTDKEREEAGVHVQKSRRSVIPPPSTVPELEPRAGVPRQIVVPYRDKGSTRRGKPRDVHGIEVRHAFLDHEPRNIKELANSSFDTKSPLILNFGEEDRGRRVYMAGRWEIEREGIKGEFGDIVSAIVP
jgi:hypothetical protein